MTTTKREKQVAAAWRCLWAFLILFVASAALTGGWAYFQSFHYDHAWGQWATYFCACPGVGTGVFAFGFGLHAICNYLGFEID